MIRIVSGIYPLSAVRGVLRVPADVVLAGRAPRGARRLCCLPARTQLVGAEQSLEPHDANGVENLLQDLLRSSN